MSKELDALHCDEERVTIMFLLRLASIGLGLGLTLPSIFAASVTLRNVSYPFTPIEVDHTVEVSIDGATPNGTVTVVQNGGEPFVFGTTDSFGHWSVQAVEQQSNVGGYNQVWYVNDVAIPPANPNQTILPFAPSLPNFEVVSRTLATGVPPQVPPVLINKCGGNSAASVWRFNPVTYGSSSSYGPSVVNAAASLWNAPTQSRISLVPFSSADIDVFIWDAALPGNDFGVTAIYNESCSSCYGYRLTCNSACMNEAAVWEVNIRLDTSKINSLATATAMLPAQVATATLAHEFGHALILDHPSVLFANDGRCSSVGSLMFPMVQGMFLCGKTSPNSLDVNGINSVFPSSPGSCPTDTVRVCSTGNPC